MRYNLTIIKHVAERIEIEAKDKEHAQEIAIEKVEREKEYGENIVSYYVESIKEEKYGTNNKR